MKAGNAAQPIAREDIARTHTLIAPHIRKTPVIDVDGACVKLEGMQHAGSFKTRGAFTNLLTRVRFRLPEWSPHRAVIMAPPSHMPR